MNNRIQIWGLTVLLVGHAVVVFCEVNKNQSIKYSNTHNIFMQGVTELRDLSLMTQLIVKGSLTAKDCNFKNVHVTQSCEMKNCQVIGNVVTQGSSVHMSDCNVMQSVYVRARVASFKDSRIKGSVHVKKLSRWVAWFRTQKVILRDTLVEKDIIFESKNGVVEVSQDGQVKGSVINGSIRRK